MCADKSIIPAITSYCRFLRNLLQNIYLKKIFKNFASGLFDLNLQPFKGTPRFCTNAKEQQRPRAASIYCGNKKETIKGCKCKATVYDDKVICAFISSAKRTRTKSRFRKWKLVRTRKIIRCQCRPQFTALVNL